MNKSIKSELSNLLNELCVDFGFCLPKAEIDKITSKKSYTADQFVKDVFVAEGMGIDANLRLMRQIKKRFTDKFGKEITENEY